MTTSQKNDVDAVIDRGLRQFYAPPLLADGSTHIWSFMRPTMNIVVHAPYSVGTITSIDSTPAATAIFAASTLPTWVVNGTLTYVHPTTENRSVIHIRTWTNATTLNLSDAVLSDEFVSGTVPYEISDGVYLLPTSFAGIEGDVTLEDGTGYLSVRQVGEDQIRELFGGSGIQTGRPAYFCTRPTRDPTMDSDGTDGAIGQYSRHEMVFFPKPDATYRMSFKYLFMFPGVDDYVSLGVGVANTHPPGIAYHHETILASCLAVAEQYADSPNGEYKEYFAKRMAASVAIDRKTAGSPYMGRNLDRSDTLHSQSRVTTRSEVTYNNILY
jgi:hypothetical protein